MIRPFLFVMALGGMTACGVDGEPPQPEPAPGETGVPVTGDALVGMSVGSSGARGYGAVRLNNGPVSLSLGL